MKKIFIILLVCAVAAIASAKANDKIIQPVALDAIGVNAVKQIDPNLDGSDINVAVICRSVTYTNGEPQNDYQPNISHNCFEPNQFTFYDKGELQAGNSSHSTAICSILFGLDVNTSDANIGEFDYEGILPAAKADIYEMWYFLTENVFTQSLSDSDIITASFGSQTQDWWTRGIEAIAQYQGVPIIAGIGNGTNSYNSTLYPGASANVIGVGVVDSVNTTDLEKSLASFALAQPEHSSTGPTKDNRCKPDIVAPGNCLVADVNDTSNYKISGNWSSFATPIVAGVAGLLVQKAKQDPNLSAAVSKNGGNCVIKTILLNSATKLPYWHKGRIDKKDDHYAPLDYVQGAGMVNAAAAYEQLTAGMSQPGKCAAIGWDLNQVNADDENVYKINFQSDKEFITATLAWNRHYKNKYPFESQTEKNNNLQVEIWAVNPDNSGDGYLLDYSDSANDNVEHIYCKLDPNYSNYEIVISHSDVNDIDKKTTQQYALAWSIAEEPNMDNIFWYDLNADGTVDEHDYFILVENWITNIKDPTQNLIGDINADGLIDVKDLDVLMSYFAAPNN